MKLIETVKSCLIEQHTINDIKLKYVGDNKPISEDQFKEINEVTGGKLAYTKWVVLQIVRKNIKLEDVYKFKNYFIIFEKNKNKFEIKDINQYKTDEDIRKFISTCIKIREKDIVFDDIDSSDKFITKNEIEKLNLVGIKYYGISEGYQVFEIPNKLKDNKEAWKVYRDTLGKCAGRDKGAKIELCTVASFDHFNSILGDNPNSSYFLMYNLSDPKSPYQFHYESKQFMDKDDSKLLS